MVKDTPYMAALQQVEGLGKVRLQKLIDFFGSAQQAWQAKEAQLVKSQCLPVAVCQRLVAAQRMLEPERLAEQWTKQGIKLCSFDEPDYPQLLRNTFQPPMVFYYRGTLPCDDKLIAIVGARKASAYGKNAAKLLAEGAAAAGVWVVSGAARGIDTAVHQGALMTGKTIAVLGCGLNVTYPPENQRLLAEIAEKGAVLSEYSPETAPQPGFFPARNRIISGLARGVVVVEAGEKSGALITADFSLEEGRDVFAVPGSIFAEGCVGTHRLLKQGAKLVDNIADILEEYGWEPETKQAEVVTALSQEEQCIYQLLKYDMPLDMETIVQQSGLSVTTVAVGLLQLELRGLASQQDGKRYLRIAREGIR